jgi:cation diffusion facilitator family transporter
MNQQCTIEERDTTVFLANEQKTKWVTIITLITMVVEVVVGYWSGSMALLADGWHMASHALALALSLVVYFLYRHPRFRASFTFGGGKILSLGGYTSAVLLVVVAVSMIVESFQRFSEQRAIHYSEALTVAVIGLVVNLICAAILHQKEDIPHMPHSQGHDHDHGNCSHNKLAPAGHHHHHHHGHNHSHGHSHAGDHNHASAYMHILTDALTSLFAIGALLLAQWKGWTWADPLVGVVGGIVVGKWALGLIKTSGMDLLDAHDASIDRENLVKTLEVDGSKVVDMHLWKLAPGQVGGEIIIKRNADQPSAYYRDLIQRNFSIQHLIIEVV